MGIKYTAGTGFTVEKVYRMSTFVWDSQNWIQKFLITFFFLKLIKNMLV